MAKKSKAQEQKPVESRPSFLPEDPPLAPPEVATSPTVADAPTVEAPKAEKPQLGLKVERLKEPRWIQITLTIPPLASVVEKFFLPMKYSEEQLAAITADAIRRAAQGLAADGVYQHARREEEDARTREAMRR